RIEQFVMSNDIMEEEVFDDLMKLITRYLEKDLAISHFALLMEGIVNNKPGLETKWSMSEVRSSYSLPENPENGYEHFSTYAFGKHMPLWMVNVSEDSPDNGESWKDLWSRNTDVPPDGGIFAGIQTSIRHPVMREGFAIGVLELASKKYVEPTPVSCDEITKLAEVIGKAYSKMALRKLQRDNTRIVIEQLGRALDNETWTRLALPKMFVAFSGGTGLEGETQQSHQAVIDTIRQVVAEFDGILEAVFWDESEESGNITMQVIREISLSEYGICYFSEPDENGEHPYRDNPNVLFEAGMMQALQNSAGALLKGWIPIREAESPKLPFDVAAERMLTIDRAEDPNCTNLALTLKSRIEKLIELGGSQPAG
ncbi:MAG: nucleotide-binding protein, partial [Anaerolineae bacterium]|nr:nucleotide-binding protein [Anaerolineae bacterium]